uniref:Uncharacterized protein n=1 Tax=Trichuris muris TaxID=70415 RepID=A0A5S6QGN2_TRIMR
MAPSPKSVGTTKVEYHVCPLRVLDVTHFTLHLYKRAATFVSHCALLLFHLHGQAHVSIYTDICSPQHNHLSLCSMPLP